MSWELQKRWLKISFSVQAACFISLEGVLVERSGDRSEQQLLLAKLAQSSSPWSQSTNP